MAAYRPEKQNKHGAVCQRDLPTPEIASMAWLTVWGPVSSVYASLGGVHK